MHSTPHNTTLHTLTEPPSLTPLYPPLTFVLLPVGSHRQHLLHQLSVLWSELASEDGIPLGVMDGKGWEGRGGEGTRGERRGGEGGEGSGGREGQGSGGREKEEREGGEVHTIVNIKVNSGS